MAEKGKRGFAGMDRERQRQIASKGGRAAHQKGRAHEFTSEEAREAGRKRGQLAQQAAKAHQFSPEQSPEANREMPRQPEPSMQGSGLGTLGLEAPPASPGPG